MDRAQKEDVVDELGQIFADSGVVVVAHYEGLSVAEMTDFRLRMKQAGGGSVRVAKNKLAKIALEGTPADSMGNLLTGMTVLAYLRRPRRRGQGRRRLYQGQQEARCPWRRHGGDTLWTRPV